MLLQQRNITMVMNADQRRKKLSWKLTYGEEMTGCGEHCNSIIIVSYWNSDIYQPFIYFNF